MSSIPSHGFLISSIPSFKIFASLNTAQFFCIVLCILSLSTEVGVPPFEFLNLSNLEIDFCVSLSGITSCLEFGFTIVAALIAAALPNTTRSINELDPNLLAP